MPTIVQTEIVKGDTVSKSSKSKKVKDVEKYRKQLKDKTKADKIYFVTKDKS